MTGTSSLEPQARPVLGQPGLAAFARLTMELHDAEGVDETIGRVLEFAPQVVPCDFAGLMLRGRGNSFRTAGSCDSRVVEADRLQVDCREGPWTSRDADHNGLLVLDTADDPRWPQWGPRVAELGVRSVLSVRLRTSRSDLGLLNLYSASPHRFTDTDNATAYVLAGHATVAIATAQQTATLTRAIKSRTTIGQAQGILMERYMLDAEQAFTVLRRYSQDSNIKLYDVAARFLETRQLPSRPGAVPAKTHPGDATLAADSSTPTAVA